MLVYLLAPLPLLVFAWASMVAATKGQFLLAAVLMCAFTFNAYRIGWRTAYELRVQGDRVTWRAPLASGCIPRSSLLTARTALQLDITVLVCRDCRDVLVWKGPGLSAFLGANILPPDSNA
jgi:hypothetical protein